MKYIIGTICLLFNIYLASCSFQATFFQEMNKEFKNKNLLISPLSAYQVLGLTANGAKGKTLNQMLLALEGSSLDEVNSINKKILDVAKTFSTIEIANAVMSKFNAKKAFLNAVSLYEATFEPLKSLAQVNNWCFLKTHGKIEKIIDRLDASTLMILLNAIYFKGTWHTEFDEKNTTQKVFYNFNTEKKLVEKMLLKEKFNYYEDKQVQVVELPYKSDSMSAVIILPNKYTDINDFITGLNEDKLQRLLKRMDKQIVDLELPKFKLEFSSLLNTPLQKMGMDLPFRPIADFTGMVDGSLYISEVVQKSYLSIDEKGTEATSVTAVIMTRDIQPPVYPMVIDRPFLFLLRCKSLPAGNELLFMAKVEQL